MVTKVMTSVRRRRAASALGSTNCGRNATKNITPLGLSAVTSQVFLNSLECASRAGRKHQGQRSARSTYTVLMRCFHVDLGKIRSLQRSLLIAVAVALIGTQTIGVHHRVKHGTASGWINGVHAEHKSAGPEAGHQDPVTHDCAALDALALGNGPPASAPPLLFSEPVATPFAFRSQSDPETAALRPFHARAPPPSLS